MTLLRSDEYDVLFTVPGKPVPRSRQGRMVQGRCIVVSDSKSKSYQTHCRVQATLAMAEVGRAQIRGQLEVVLIACFPVPKSWPKRKKDQALTGVLRPATTPDFDNAIKAATDGFNRIVWGDDRQIVDCHIHKFYSAEPRLEVLVAPATIQQPSEVLGRWLS